MKIKNVLAAGLFSLVIAGGAYAQTVGDEVVFPAGAFAKDFNGIVFESGGIAGTGIQHGAYRFPKTKGSALVGITALWPLSWVGHDADIVLLGSAGGLGSGQFRIFGNFENNVIGRTVSLAAEDNGGTEVVLFHNYTVPQFRRFGIAVGRDPNHLGDTFLGDMNIEYVVLRLMN